MTSLASLHRMLTASSRPTPDDAELEALFAERFRPADPEPDRWSANREIQIAAVIPFAVAAALYMVPGYYDALFVSPPDFIGVPAGFVFQVVTLGWALLGATVIWQTRFRVMAAIALAACTTPAVVGVILMPQVIESLQNRP